MRTETLTNGADSFSQAGATEDFLVNAQDGDDRVTTGNGSDTLYGGSGADTLFGMGASDLIYGNRGADVIYGNQGNDRIYGGQDSDRVYGGQGADVVYGNLGNDVVYGNLGNDTVYGGQGDDTLYGGQGDDNLIGGLGSNTFIGGLGYDNVVVTGNTGDYRLRQLADGSFELVAKDGSSTQHLDSTVDQVTFQNGQYLALRDLAAFVDPATPSQGAGPGGGGGGGGGGGNPPPAGTISNGVLTLPDAVVYTATRLNNGSVTISAGGRSTISMSSAEFEALNRINLAQNGGTLNSGLTVLDKENITLSGAGTYNIDGVTFNEAAGATPVETNINLTNVLVGGLAWDDFRVNGSVANGIIARWDTLDDTYGQLQSAYGNAVLFGVNQGGRDGYNDRDALGASGPIYGQTTSGEAGLANRQEAIDLGVDLISYLDNFYQNNPGGTDPLAAFTAKSSTTGRDQLIRDNILGNLNTAEIDDRNLPNEQEVRLRVPDEFENRPYFSGNAGDRGGAAHDGVRAFDWDRRWNRPDWVDNIRYGTVDAAAQSDRDGDNVGEQMQYGTGNSITGWQIERHEGAGIEQALKAKRFGPNGGDYPDTPNRITYENGVPVYHVNLGTSPDNANRADWSFDYAVTPLAAGNNETFTTRLLFDIDTRAGVTSFVPVVPDIVGAGQGSSNVGFAAIRSLIDGDPNTAGQQTYNYDGGEFNIRMDTFDASGQLVNSNEIIVRVDGGANLPT